jgi:hypothetical protein
VSDNSKTQHEQLIANGWRYDAESDMYSPPGSATDGTARRYNLHAAWQALQISTADQALSEPPLPRSMRRGKDPREKEPE